MKIVPLKIKLIASVFIVFAMSFSHNVKANAATEILEANVTTPSANCVMVGMEGSFYADDQKALNRINEIRLEACKAGNVRDPRNKARFLTEADYVPIKWSTALEKTARLRAAEASMYVSYGALSHNRMNKQGTFTVKYVDSKTGQAISSSAEVLAWNWSSDMIKGIDQWYEEKSAWVNQTNAETGHYTAMINPNNKYVGLGTFCCDISRYYNTTCGEFSTSSSSLDQTQLAAKPGVVQKVEVHTSYLYNYVLNCKDKINVGESVPLSGIATLVRTKDTSISMSPVYVIYGGLSYRLSDPTLATIDSNGILTGVKGGFPKISMMNGANVLCEKTVQIYEPFTGIKKAADGNFYLYEKDVVNSKYSGLYCDKNLGWWLVNNGRVDMNYNGIYCDAKYGFWLITGGTINFGYNDFYCDAKLGWWKITGGTIDFDYTGLYCSPSIGWWMVSGGALNTTYNDLYCDINLGWWKINNGTIDFSYNGLYFSPTYGWWKISGGTLDVTYNDIYCDVNYGWWKVSNGTIDLSYNGLYCSPTYGWWLITGGQLNFGYTDVYCDAVYGWWKINGGTLEPSYSGLYCSPTCGWWLIDNGTIAFSYDDLYCDARYGWWKVNHGAMDSAYTGLFCSPRYGWWKVVKGIINFEYNGVYNDAQYGAWYISGGTIDMSFNGTVTTNGIRYIVVNGFATPAPLGRSLEDSDAGKEPGVVTTPDEGEPKVKDTDPVSDEFEDTEDTEDTETMDA